jgi:hypothetical protein
VIKSGSDGTRARDAKMRYRLLGPDLPMTWSAGDTIPLGPNRTLQVLRVRDNDELGRPADDEALF